jgi:plasmid stabilization system protein ParE
MTTTHYAEATAADWLELAAEARGLADEPGTSPESRDHYGRAALEYEIAAIAAHLAERTPMRTGRTP